MLGYVWERTLHVAKAIVKGIVKKFLKARESSETLGNARERSRGFASKGDKAIVVECVNNGISAYRRVTDRSSPPFFNFDCPQSIARRGLDRGNVDMQMNSEFSIWVLA